MESLIVLLLALSFPFSSASVLSNTDHEVLVHLISTLAAENYNQSNMIHSLIKTMENLQKENELLKNDTEQLKGKLIGMTSDILAVTQKQDSMHASNTTLNKALDVTNSKVTMLEVELNNTTNKTHMLTDSLNEEKQKTAQIDQEIRFFYQNIFDISNNLSALQLKQEARVMFTATEPKGPLPTSGNPVTFDMMKVNEGVAFDSTTGVFTCPIKGMYLFVVNLQRVVGPQEIECVVLVNDQQLIKAVIGRDDGHSSLAASNSAYVHLMSGDRVWLGYCTGGPDIKTDTSNFSGALVSMD